METVNFQELIRKREDWVRSSKENNFDFDSILAGLYNDPSHFVFEILQNAEDEGAKAVTFKLYDDRLVIFHDGEDFDSNDIDAITGIGASTKKDDVNAIGKFGVGFKSVFAVTQTPVIHSGQYHFEIRDFVLPLLIDTDGNIGNTKITLPFNHKFRPQGKIFDLVQDKLENLGLHSLLFLRNIEEIQWQSPQKSGHYLKSVKTLETVPGTKRITIIAETNHEETLQDYFVIEKSFELDGKQLKVEIAFQVGKDDENDREIIVPIADSKLIVYFPTEKVTFLKFLVQGPYKTTPNRENIPLDDEQNEVITEKIGELAADSISIIQKLGCLDVNFLNILPLDSSYIDRSSIYSTIFKNVKTKLSSGEKLLPTHNREFTTARDTLLARGRELVEIFTKADIKFLFEKNNWLDTNITYDRTQELRNYLVNTLGVQEVDFESFGRKFTADFFATKDDDWMADFYGRLNDQRALWKGILRTKPYIRLEDDSHVAPFNAGWQIQVYLPSETKSKYHTVKKTLIQNETALEFLKALGLSEPDLFAEIREFVVPKYKTDELNIPDEEYLEDFHKLLLAFTEGQWNQRQELLHSLRDLPIIRVNNPTTSQNVFLKPDEVYINREELKLYFDGHESAYFVPEILYSKFEAQDLNAFLKDLGIMSLPRRISFLPHLSENLKKELRKKSGNSGIRYEQGATDYNLDGLNHFLEQPMTPERSQLLWQFLIECIESWAREFFEGEYKWYYYTPRSQRFNAHFTKTLQESCWLLDRQGNFSPPSEIAFSELSDEYDKNYSNIDVLKEKLNFKPDILEQLPEDEKNILEITKGRSPEEIRKALALLDEQTNQDEKEDDETWQPEIEPDEADVKVEDLLPEILEPPNLEDQIEILVDDRGDDFDTDEPVIETESEPEILNTPKLLDIIMKDVGKWGEQYTFSALKMRLGSEAIIRETDYGCCISDNQTELKIYWLNIKKDVGKGYDFVIKCQDEEIEYIETKTTTEGEEALIRMTGTQWEFARKLFNKGEGDKYIIYRVFDAGRSNAQIKKLRNPVKLWREGRLYAHPVHLKL